MDDRDPHYLRVVCDYIHLNPLRAGLLQNEDSMTAYPWSSYPEYLKKPRERAKWMRVDRVLGEHGIQADDHRGRLEFGRRMEKLRQDESEGAATPELQSIRRGWRFGGEEFVARMLDRIEGLPGKNQPGGWRAPPRHVNRARRRRNWLQRAWRIVSEALEEAAWDAERLENERKGHPTKVKLARRLRCETTMSLQWIAETLCMGSWTYVSNLLRPNQKALKSAKDKD